MYREKKQCLKYFPSFMHLDEEKHRGGLMCMLDALLLCSREELFYEEQL